MRFRGSRGRDDKEGKEGSDFMCADSGKGTTASLAGWAAGFRLEDAPEAVVDRMKALVLDFLRVVAVGARLPWSRAARKLVLNLGGTGASTILLYGDRLDAFPQLRHPEGGKSYPTN